MRKLSFVFLPIFILIYWIIFNIYLIVGCLFITLFIFIDLLKLSIQSIKEIYGRTKTGKK
jgi:hypothetical protein